MPVLALLLEPSTSSHIRLLFMARLHVRPNQDQYSIFKGDIFVAQAQKRGANTNELNIVNN